MRPAARDRPNGKDGSARILAAGIGRLLGAARRHPVRLALASLVVLALGLRVAEYVAEPRPLAGAGLAAEQAEMARNIVDHGNWFALNQGAYELLKQRQAEEQQLVDPARVDFSRVDRESKAEPVVDQMPGVAGILAVMWWVTGTETYSPLQWLQI